MKPRMQGLLKVCWFAAYGLTLAACAESPPADREGPVARTEGALSSGAWVRIENPFPGGGYASNVALLTDGRVLASGEGTSNSWYTLTPDISGSYANGTWTQVPSSHHGSLFGVSFILPSGRFLLCGGEYNDDMNERDLHGPDPIGNIEQRDRDRAHCEIFDPSNNFWTRVGDMPETIADTAATELPDGRVLILSHASTASYIFDEGTRGWVRTDDYDRDVVDTEGDCILLQDGNAFCGKKTFAQFSPSNGWTDVRSTPQNDTDEFTSSNQSEIGPMMLLPSGQVLVLGGDKKNGIYTPSVDGSSDSWALAADTPYPYNHGDAPSAVEANGNVLTVVTTDPSGGGQPDDVVSPPGPFGKVAFYEFGASRNPQWAPVPLPPFDGDASWGLGNRMRLLNLPQQDQDVAQILVSGATDGSMWIYTSPNTPKSSWRPTLTSISAPTNGTFVLEGTQLNGLTLGANLGDDAKMATNYPLVYLTNGSLVFYANTWHFDQMAPRPDTPGSCAFTLPPNLPNLEYDVHVSVNGVDSINALALSVDEMHVVDLSGPETAGLNASVTWTVRLSNLAPAGGTVVTLVSDAAVASVPATVTVPAGSATATFPVTVRAYGIARISAQAGPGTSFIPLQKYFGWSVNELSGPDIVYGTDMESNFKVTLSRPAGPTGVVVSLSSGNVSIARAPQSVTVLPGQTSASFIVTRISDGVAWIAASVLYSTISHTLNTAVGTKIGPKDRAQMSYFKCAEEGDSSVCELNSARYTAYGAGGKFYYQVANGNGEIGCNNIRQPGDPAPGTHKACYYSSYVFLANQGASTSLPNQKNVAYGANGVFNFKDMVGTFTCDDATFGSPIDGPKACYYAPPYYDFRAGQDQMLTVDPKTPVAYGGGGGFVYKIMSGTFRCSDDTFTDPAEGSRKSCYVLTSPFRADQGQPFSSAYSRRYYGSGTNSVFMVNEFISRDVCTAQFDPDLTRPKHCYGL